MFETSHEMFLDDDEMEDGFDEVKFVKKYRRWEMKDTNEEIDDIKFSPLGAISRQLRQYHLHL